MIKYDLESHHSEPSYYCTPMIREFIKSKYSHKNTFCAIFLCHLSLYSALTYNTVPLQLDTWFLNDKQSLQHDAISAIQNKVFQLSYSSQEQQPGFQQSEPHSCKKQSALNYSLFIHLGLCLGNCFCKLLSMWFQ